MSKRILITGYRGFVGRAFLRYFKKIGMDDALFFGVDIKDGKDCRDFFKSEESNRQFDLVIHLAAIVGGRMTIEGNPIAVATDLSIDAEMFNWAVRTKQPRIVYFSSSAAYPIALQTGKEFAINELNEDDIKLNNISNPDMTYGWAKLTGEMLAEYAQKEGVKVHVFRPFSGYGEDQDLDYPFPSFIKRAKDIRDGKLDAFEVWGDGEQVRDFIHMDDIVEAVMKAIEEDIKGPINLGSGIATSFNELAKTCMHLAGRIVPIVHHLEKPVGVGYRVSDNTKMLTFYQPKITLKNGIKKALEN